MAESPTPPFAEEPALSARAVLIGGTVLLVAAILATLTWVNSAAISEEEIARRCAQAEPQWDNYPEDIKGMIGAGPASEWHGRPLTATLKDGTLEVVFEVEGEWAGREAALPILVKDPAGSIRTARGKTREGTSRYVVEVSAGAPWVEVQYPHHRERMGFDARGEWRAAVGLR